MFNRILVVCTGNICRSPMAEELLRSSLPKTGFLVQSAGVAALVGESADPLAIRVMQEHGYDIMSHRAQQLNQPLLLNSDLVLSLDQSHNDWINSRYPHLRGRAHKFGRWQNNMDIADPYRKPQAAFEQAFQDIRISTENWIKRIIAS